jgi:hypothetical protein
MLRGRFSRVVAALLALALLVLPGAPMRHAQAAAPSPQHAAHPCPRDAEAAQDPALASPDQRSSQRGDIPGLTCCRPAPCPTLVGAPPPAATAPLPRPAPAVRFAAVPRLRLGIDIPPALPPPRAA